MEGEKESSGLTRTWRGAEGGRGGAGLTGRVARGQRSPSSLLGHIPKMISSSAKPTRLFLSVLCAVQLFAFLRMLEQSFFSLGMNVQ